MAIPSINNRPMFTPTAKKPPMETTPSEYEYTIVKSRYGLYTSVLKDGTKMTTALTEEACRFVTDNIRIPVMKGEYDGWTSTLGSAVVGGKL